LPPDRQQLISLERACPRWLVQNFLGNGYRSELVRAGQSAGQDAFCVSVVFTSAVH